MGVPTMNYSSPQVRAKVAENFNNNDFSAKPWRKWMKSSVQDAIDRLEEMTDPEPMTSPPESAAASPKKQKTTKKSEDVALKPAPGVDTCSDQFIDDAEDIVQEALDEHRDSKRKGDVSHVARKFFASTQAGHKQQPRPVFALCNKAVWPPWAECH